MTYKVAVSQINILSNCLTNCLKDRLIAGLTKWLTNGLIGWRTNWQADWPPDWHSYWVPDYLTSLVSICLFNCLTTWLSNCPTVWSFVADLIFDYPTAGRLTNCLTKQEGCPCIRPIDRPTSWLNKQTTDRATEGLSDWFIVKQRNVRTDGRTY